MSWHNKEHQVEIRTGEKKNEKENDGGSSNEHQKILR